jgi:hypothetical protein
MKRTPKNRKKKVTYMRAFATDISILTDNGFREYTRKPEKKQIYSELFKKLNGALLDCNP